MNASKFSQIALINVIKHYLSTEFIIIYSFVNHSLYTLYGLIINYYFYFLWNKKQQQLAHKLIIGLI